MEREVSSQFTAAIGEQRLEYPAHGQHGGTGVDRRASDPILPNLPTWARVPLKHRDGDSLPRQVCSGGQTGRACSDDDHTLRARWLVIDA
jgi:hypothetical protein